MNFPYSYISCPCVDVSTPIANTYRRSEAGEEGEEQEQMTFNPRSPRTNFSLYPLEQLLYCEDCQQIRCPRCTIEEISCWYCPNCIFEFPSSMVQGDGGRCTRNCFNCPICTAPMSVNSLHAEPKNALSGPWILACGYCNWTTLDISITFDKSSSISGQVSRLRNSETLPKTPSRSEESAEEEPRPKPDSNPNSTFRSLKSFYTSQLSASSPTNPLLTPAGEISYNSPSSLARIMSLYTGLGSFKKTNTKVKPMRESADPSEGLRVIDPNSDRDAIRGLRTQGFSSTVSVAQRAEDPRPQRFLDDLLPLPTLLRTKRNKRCRTCRHILVKPEAKIQSTRFRIKLVAINYIPTISLKALSQPQQTAVDLNALLPLRPTQFLLTLKNPIFDTLRVTLATPAQTPGLHGHRVTILCPQFKIGANVDVWDEALGSSNNNDARDRSSKSLSRSKTDGSTGGDSSKVAEAGKVWDKGRNWTTVVVEVVCAEIPSASSAEERRRELQEDEDVVEIPVFVRLEWDGDDGGDDAGIGAVRGSVKRELAYWVVVGAGKVAPLIKG